METIQEIIEVGKKQTNKQNWLDHTGRGAACLAKVLQRPDLDLAMIKLLLSYGASHICKHIDDEIKYQSRDPLYLLAHNFTFPFDEQTTRRVMECAEFFREYYTEVPQSHELYSSRIHANSFITG